MRIDTTTENLSEVESQCTTNVRLYCMISVAAIVNLFVMTDVDDNGGRSVPRKGEIFRVLGLSGEILRAHRGILRALLNLHIGSAYRRGK